MTRTDDPDIASLSLGVDDELERFRREWKEEVARRGPEKLPEKPVAEDTEGGASAAKGTARTESTAAAAKGTAAAAKGKGKEPEAAVDIPAPKSPTVARGSLATSPTKIPFRAPQVRKDRDGAIGVYSRAVEAEQSGKLNDALKLYRTAFKMDDNVDKLYQRQVAKVAQVEAAAAAAVVGEPSVEDVVDPSVPQVPEYDFRRHIQLAPDHERQVGGTSRLTLLLRNAPSADFAAADEELPIPIAKLPAELLDPVLSHLDVGSIEALAATCWRARTLTAHAGVWRSIVNSLFRPPMIPPSISAHSLVRRHDGEWRTTLVEEERIRLDGCYISVCHYIRPGAGEEWVAITHMITYHRFLRFYPDGLVISFLTTDHPSDVVPHLNPSLRGKGLHFGRWRLVRSDSDEDDSWRTDARSEVNEKSKSENNGTSQKSKEKEKEKENENGKAKGDKPKRARIEITELIEPGLNDPKYEFEMHLGLRETTRGRWNKLDLAQYSTINLSTGEVLNLNLQHQKPFYFSKVRSWSPAL